eukprot:TRINITY_DN12471_c0_g1::TRINITY_DN12471_c0_g1_i1::g.15078::m.15078 TRINITY_DN12471_c0_g1::TRINITY_DN12471_c0_g1_i1::g.15078  ORF type:complete len:521 (+),score=139.69,sp/P33189/YHXA_BACSU/32.26/3e-57,Aminotran_3/PF00202.16/1.5e+03,Aminotran_3/PF00202.16/1.2e-72,Beta_elim_lyase/PF01212.16/0.036 TRINITY_DN12471_c0_g1_i1:38-1564(+)
MLRRVASDLAKANGQRLFSSRVNELYRPGMPGVKHLPKRPQAELAAVENPDTVKAILAHHQEREWSKEEVEEATKKHAAFTWAPQDAAFAGALHAVRGDGVYFYDANGKRYLDFNSMAMCTHFGHTPPQSLIDAVTKQLQTLAYAYPGAAYTPIRAKFCKLLSDICPGDINSFLFPSSGSEANECAMRVARVTTGRFKIMSRYRSYHGGTLGAMALTGDQRRWPTEPGATGIVHFFDPYPYSFSLGASEEEITKNSLTQLREQIMYEGPHTIASIVLESVTGTNGVLPPPKGYLEGIREICDEFGILMHCDEVMAGFGRTGKLFGFMHAGVVPDIVTFAKGVNGAFVPLAGVGMRDHVVNTLRTKPIAYGSTYNGHPVALATGYVMVQELLKNGVIENSAKMGTVMSQCMKDLAANHPSIKQARNIGLFGCLDIAGNKQGDFIARVTDPLPPAMVQFKKALYENGMFTMMRGHNVFCNPPLVITESQLREGFAIIDKCLPILDKALKD